MRTAIPTAAAAAAPSVPLSTSTVGVGLVAFREEERAPAPAVVAPQFQSRSLGEPYRLARASNYQLALKGEAEFIEIGKYDESTISDAARRHEDRRAGIRAVRA